MNGGLKLRTQDRTGLLLSSTERSQSVLNRASISARFLPIAHGPRCSEKLAETASPAEAVRNCAIASYRNSSNKSVGTPSEQRPKQGSCNGKAPLREMHPGSSTALSALDYL